MNTAILQEVRKNLVENAVECTVYVSRGKLAKRELAEKHSITEEEAGKILDKACADLCNEILCHEIQKSTREK